MTRCEKNSQYSLRSYAKALDMDCSTLSKILRGKRVLGKRLIRKLAPSLNLSLPEIEKFISYDIRQKNLFIDRESDDLEYLQHTLDNFQIISDWYHYAILELMRLDYFIPDSKWIPSQSKGSSLLILSANSSAALSSCPCDSSSWAS